MLFCELEEGRFRYGGLFAVHSTVREQKEEGFCRKLYRVRVWDGRESGNVQVGVSSLVKWPDVFNRWNTILGIS